MYYITEIACVVVEIWMIHMLMASSAAKKDRPWWHFGLAYTAFGLVIAVFSFVQDAAFVRFGICFLTVWAFSVFLFENNILRGLVPGFIYLTLTALVEMLCSLIMVWAGVDGAAMMAYGNPRAIFLILNHVVLFAVIVPICLFRRRNEAEVSWRILLPVLPCWIVTILLCSLLLWQVLMLEQTMHWAYFCVMLGLLYTNMLVIYCMIRMERQARQQKEAELAEHHYAMQQEYYDQFRAQQEETRAIWHDISKYLRAVQADDTNQSWEQIRQMMDSVSCVVDVNNRVVSILLNEYVQAAKNAGVELCLDVQVPPELFVTAADLYVLIGNTLDNALQACRELPAQQRKIVLKLKTHNSILFYEIENPDVEQTPKRSDRFHGYGLKNARRCAQRYNGNLEVIRENGMFRVRAYLNSV